VARDLASRGAQLIILTQQPLSDPFFVDYILDLRNATDNQLITAEHVDLSSLHSVRTFATKWIDNVPPRRLDMIILCANTFTPPGGKAVPTVDGIEPTWAVNYLGHFHLLSILSPAIRAQPPDRDVRIIFGTCSSYMGGQLPDFIKKTTPAGKSKSKSSAQSSASATAAAIPSVSPYATSKFALTTFALAFQTYIWAYDRPDKNPMNARVILVDPGLSRTPGTRRFLTFGSLWGLFLYLVMWPFWWLVLKSPEQGAQSFLTAAMEAQFGRGEGGWLIKECRQVEMLRKDCKDVECQKELWEGSEAMIEILEKEGAMKRAREKKEKEAEEEEKARSAAKAASAEKQPGSRRSRKA